MKTFRKLNIIFAILVAITGGLGLGFLIDALFVGYTDPNGIIYSIVSCVSFVICIALLVTIVCLNIVGTKKAIKKETQQSLIILPSKTNISFDPKDIGLFLVDRKESPKHEFTCLIDVDTQSCATCRAKNSQLESSNLDQNKIENQSKHESILRNVENLISGVSKDTNLIVLKQKQKGKVFVPANFIEWPVEEKVLVEVIENNEIDIPFEEKVVIEEIPMDSGSLKILNSKNDIASVEAIVETFETDEIPMEEESITYCDEENVYIQDSTVEDNEEYIDNEQVVINGPVVEDDICELADESNEEYIDNEQVVINDPVVEDDICELADESSEEYIDNEQVVIDGPVVEQVYVDEPIMDEQISAISQQVAKLFEHNAQFVEWPVQRKRDVITTNDEIEENKVEGEPTPVVKEQKISIKEVQHEKEFVVEAEDLFENEEIVGDDSRVFDDPDELEAVAMTLKKTITSSLFTGKQNVVFVKRPPIRLFTKIYIIDRASQSIIGEATVRIYERGLKKQIWNKYGKKSTISKDQYDTYYSSSLLACALVIKTVSKYKRPAPIAHYGINKVPSTFIYIAD